MQREISVAEVENTLNEDNISETIVVKRSNKSDVVIMNIDDYKRVIENKFVSRLKRAEGQIKNGEITDGDIVLAKMRKEYGYRWSRIV